MIRIKICCISSIEEARLAFKYGASAVGLVSEMPGGPGIISEDLIREIANSVPPPVATFLLTSKTSAEEIIGQQIRTNVNTIQLVDYIQPDETEKIKTALPFVKIVQVIHVRDEYQIDEAIEAEKTADAVLLDSGNPALEIKELGGTGRTHNWEISRKICERIKKPVFLAGGLNADNVKSAISFVKPFGVDICSGVRTNGRLDEIKLKRFVSSVFY
ncbi:MAG: phosphoribosylanthranilate isomerase [Ignavibacteriaceae bacterium]